MESLGSYQSLSVRAPLAGLGEPFIKPASARFLPCSDARFCMLNSDLRAGARIDRYQGEYPCRYPRRYSSRYLHRLRYAAKYFLTHYLDASANRACTSRFRSKILFATETEYNNCLQIYGLQLLLLFMPELVPAAPTSSYPLPQHSSSISPFQQPPYLA